MDIKRLAKRVHQLAVTKGWWERSAYSEGRIAEALLNIHSEISEASEAARDAQYDACIDRETGKPEGMAIELADTIIRILDLCEACNLDIESAIAMKAEYNEHRPYRHGRKVY